MRPKRANQLPLSGLWPDHRLAKEQRAVIQDLGRHPSPILKLILHAQCDTGLRPGGSGSLRRAGAALGPLQNLASAVLCQVGVSPERLQKFPSLRPLALALVPQCVLSAGEHQPDPSRHLAADQPAPGPMGRPERGRKIRVDATAMGSPIRHPPDFRLLNDAIRVLTRLLCRLVDITRMSCTITSAGPIGGVWRSITVEASVGSEPIGIC